MIQRSNRCGTDGSDAASRANRPSLIWVWPLAVGWWSSLMGLGWMAGVTSLAQNWKSDLLITVPMSMIVPMGLLLMWWVALTRASITRRLLAGILLLGPGVAVGFLSLGLPGDDAWWPAPAVSEMALQVLDERWRNFSVEIVFLTLGLAGLLIWLINPILGRIHLGPHLEPSRVPSLDARLASQQSPREHTGVDPIARRGRALWTWLLVLALMLGFFGWQQSAENAGGNTMLAIWVSLSWGLAAVTYGVGWLSACFRWRFIALSVLWLGLLPIPMAFSLLLCSRHWGQSWEAWDPWIMLVAAGLGPVSLSLAVALLGLTGQLPQFPAPPARRPPTPGTDRNISPDPAEVAVPRRAAPRSPWLRRAWPVGFVITWLLACGVAYWIPRNLDMQTAIKHDTDPWTSGRLTVKVMRAFGEPQGVYKTEFITGPQGQTWPIFSRSILFGRDRIEFVQWQRHPGGSKPVVVLPCLTEAEDDLVAALEDAAARGLAGVIDIAAPVSHYESLHRLLDAGFKINVGLLLAEDRPMDLPLLQKFGLNVLAIYGGELTPTIWQHLSDPIRLVDCRLPENVHPNYQRRIELWDCQIPPERFSDLADLAEQNTPVVIFVGQYSSEWKGTDLLRFLQAGGEIKGTPSPWPRLWEKDFPNLFERMVIGQRTSYLRVSAMNLLTEPESLEALRRYPDLASEVALLDDLGRPVELVLDISKLLPQDAPWNTMEHVQILTLRFSYFTDLDPAVNQPFPLQAFPALRSLAIRWTEQVKITDDQVETFQEWLSPVILAPQIEELQVQEPNPHLWPLLVKRGPLERLIIEVAPVPMNANPGDRPDDQWVQHLKHLPGLRQLVVVDDGVTQMEAYLRRLHAAAQTPGQSDLETENDESTESEEETELAAAAEELDRQQRVQFWEERIQSFAPNLEVLVVDQWDPDQR